MLRKNKTKELVVLSMAFALLVTGLVMTAWAKKPDKPGGGKGKGGDKTAYSVDAVSDVSDHDPGFKPLDPTLHSTCSGSTGENTLFVKWPRFPAQCIVITPTGSSYALTDDPQLSVIKKRGKVIAVQLWIQDVSGPDGIMHSSDQIPVDPPVEPSSAGFTLHLHADAVPVWRHKGHTGGPKVEMIGTISVGDIVYTPVAQ